MLSADKSNADRDPSGRTEVYRTALGRRAAWRILPLALLGVVIALSAALRGTLSTLDLATLIWVAAMVVWPVVGTTYRVGGGKLVVATAFRRNRIALDEIAEIRKVSIASGEILDIRRQPRRTLGWNPWTWSDYGKGDYALGTDVIEIITPSSRFLLSPRDEKGFLAALDSCTDVGGLGRG